MVFMYVLENAMNESLFKSKRRDSALLLRFTDLDLPNIAILDL